MRFDLTKTRSERRRAGHSECCSGGGVKYTWEIPFGAPPTQRLCIVLDGSAASLDPRSAYMDVGVLHDVREVAKVCRPVCSETGQTRSH